MFAQAIGSSYTETCVCGRAFFKQSAYTNHKRSCRKSQEQLSSALDKAKRRWTEKKMQRLQVLQSSSDTCSSTDIHNSETNVGPSALSVSEQVCHSRWNDVCQLMLLQFSLQRAIPPQFQSRTATFLSQNAGSEDRFDCQNVFATNFLKHCPFFLLKLLQRLSRQLLPPSPLAQTHATPHMFEGCFALLKMFFRYFDSTKPSAPQRTTQKKKWTLTTTQISLELILGHLALHNAL
jgi:hypothetical protein